MIEFLCVYGAIGFAALGGNLVTKKQTRVPGVLALLVAIALGAPIVAYMVQSAQ